MLNRGIKIHVNLSLLPGTCAEIYLGGPKIFLCKIITFRKVQMFFFLQKKKKKKIHQNEENFSRRRVWTPLNPPLNTPLPIAIINDENSLNKKLSKIHTEINKKSRNAYVNCSVIFFIISCYYISLSGFFKCYK